MHGISTGSSGINSPQQSEAPFRFMNYIWISLYWFALSFLWGGFLSIVLPALNKPLAEPIFGNNYETARGILSSIGLIIAMFVQPLSGAISDNSSHPMGRRRPFIIVGTLGGLGALALCALAFNWWILLLGYCILQFTDNTAQGAYQGLMPDTVPEGKRGRASASLAIAQLSGTLFGAVVPGILQGMMGDIDGSRLMLLLNAVIFVIAMSLTVIFVKEKPYHPTVKISPMRAGFNMFGGLRKYPDFLILMVARFLFLTAPASISLFAKSFLEREGFIKPKVNAAGLPVDADGLVLLDPSKYVIEAGFTLSILLGLVIIGAVVASFPASLLSDKIGRKKVIYLASVFGLIGGLGLFIPRIMMANAVQESLKLSGFVEQQAYLDTVRPGATILVIVFGAFIGTSWGSFMSVDWAFATDLIPLSEAGRFMGLSNLATAGCQAFGAFVGGFIVDSSLGYSGLFVAIALYYLISITILTRVRETRGRGAHPLNEGEVLA
ncbi:MAG: MFS transporter [Chloroflexi bacterium]|uniref:MFS transporter n=1 Tax=Candidatus Chlorohelix allophototropha TaxID=3003348 RepID=A0A8T7M858_9CHLR|nr:MFS transporter [Chloroflexota bacterium]WJW68259.1 MFS transporter [Chloroflexota bacterium L227-S17]